MFNVGGGEFVLILLVALIVLGPQKLPEAARQVGKIMGEFRRVSSGFQREMQAAMNDPLSKVTGEATPKTITDVTKVAEIAAPEALDDARSNDPSHASDANSDANDPSHANDADAALTTQPPEEPPEAPMYSDR